MGDVIYVTPACCLGARPALERHVKSKHGSLNNATCCMLQLLVCTPIFLKRQTTLSLSVFFFMSPPLYVGRRDISHFKHPRVLAVNRMATRTFREKTTTKPSLFSTKL